MYQQQYGIARTANPYRSSFLNHTPAKAFRNTFQTPHRFSHYREQMPESILPRKQRPLLQRTTPIIMSTTSPPIMRGDQHPPIDDDDDTDDKLFDFSPLANNVNGNERPVTVQPIYFNERDQLTTIKCK